MNVLITGAGRGLGTAFVRVYLEEGNRVYAGVRKEPGDALRSLREEFPDTLTVLPLDVTSTESCQAAAKTVEGKIDLIVNNAAVQAKDSKCDLPDCDLDGALLEYNVNAIGPLRVAKAFLDHLKEGSIIANISSEAGSIQTNWRKSEYGYCMSKAALNRGSVILGEYLKDKGIKVMCIHPGWLRTDMGGENAIHEPNENARVLMEYIDAYKDAEDTPFFDFEGQIFPW